jgi:hypothetical protein
VYVAFGKEAPEVLDETIRNAQGAGGDAGDGVDGEAAPRRLAAALEAAPEGAFAIGEVSVIEYARFWGDLMASMAPAGMMPGLELGEGPSEPLTFWASVRDARLELRYNVPVDPVKRVVAGVQEMFAKMAEMRKAAAPPPMPPDDGDGDVEEF